MVAASPPADDGIVKVTLNTVYQQQLATSVDLAEIKGTLLLLSQNMTHVIDVGKDHESRLRDLEKAVVGHADFDRLEGRVSQVEQNGITRTGVWAALGFGVMLAGALATFLSLAIK